MTYAAPPPAPALAAQLLVGPRFTHAPYLGPRYLAAVAGIGAGLDHLTGELALAFSEARAEDERFVCGAVFTDRRLLALTYSGLADLPYPAVTDVRAASGMVFDDLHVTAWGRPHKIAGLPEMTATAMFLQALLRVAPEHRVPPPYPLVTPTAEDPTGGAAASRGIWSRDVRVLPLVGMALEGHRRGWISAEAGADQVARAMLFDRTLTYGRGSHGGWWTSPLSAPDLAHAFGCMLGAPYNWYQEGHTLVHDYRLGGGGGGSAAASTAVGLVALGVLGVGWVSTPGRSLQAVRVKIVPGNGSSGFALFDGFTPLSRDWQRTLATLFEVLPRIEGRLLIQRAAFGWAPPPAELDAIPMDALFRKVAEAIGEIEIGIFFPRG